MPAMNATTIYKANHGHFPANRMEEQPQTCYAIYKYGTRTVMEWGQQKFTVTTQRRITEIANHDCIITALNLDCLETLARLGIPMPDTLLRRLRRAVTYRKRVNSYYKYIAIAKQADLATHHWLIQFLERLERQFCNLNRKLDDGLETAPIDKSLSAPSNQELETEERIFAISLIISEIDQAREGLRLVWKDWAANCCSQMGKDQQAANLLAATACTDYTVGALLDLIAEIEVETGFSVDDFLTSLIVDTTTVVNNQQTSSAFEVGNCVTIRNLHKYPKYNGKHGRITKILQDGRLGVKLFDYGSHNRSAKKQLTLSISSDNLMSSDNLLLCLNQVNKALRNFGCDSRPLWDPSKNAAVAKGSSIPQDKLKCMESCLENQEFVGFLHLVVPHVLPLWLSCAQYLPDSAACKPVLVCLLRDFAQTTELKFQLVLAMLLAVDCAMIAAATDGECAKKSSQLCSKVLQRLHAGLGATPDRVWDVLPWHSLDATPLHSYLACMPHDQNESSSKCFYFPWVSGEFLLYQLCQHLEFGTSVLYACCGGLASLFHLYWMLRSEGSIEPLLEIEHTLMRAFGEQVTFLGGVPEKGETAHVKAWELTMGEANLLASLDKLEVTGCHGHDISQLLKVLQSRSMPICSVKRSLCFDKIQRIAREEYHTLFTAPLVSVCAKLLRLENMLCSKNFVDKARCAGPTFGLSELYSSQTQGAVNICTICHWGMCLADGHTDSVEASTGLSLLTEAFQEVFEVVGKAEELEAANS